MQAPKINIPSELFSALESWFTKHQRVLPWRTGRTPYRVWLSEIMLQQTQVSVVESYFQRFITRFPNIQALAAASEDEVLALWSGLGYYSRGRNLYRTAQTIVEHFGGEFPSDVLALQSLPGVGSYTAGAISAFAFQLPAAVVDGNVARVLARLFNDDTIVNSSAGKQHFESISDVFSKSTQTPNVLQEAFIELGATICKPKNPCCEQCPVSTSCQSRLAQTVDQLPKKQTKGLRKEMHIACAILHTDTHVWLEKNHRIHLFGGLYEPPHQIFTPPESPATALSKIPLPSAGRVLSPILIKRTLTHRDLFLYGFRIPLPHDHVSRHLISRDRLNQIGISSATTEVLKQCLAP